MTQPIIQQIRVETTGASQAEQALKRVSTSLKDVDKAASSGNGGGALARAQSVAGAAGGVLSTVGGSQIASVASSVLGLTTQLGAVGLVAGVAVGGLSLLNAEMERQTKVAEDYANALKSQADLVASGATTEDVQGRIGNLSASQDFIDARIAELNAYYDKAEAIDEQFYGSNDPQKLTDALAGIFAEVSAVTGTTITDFSQLQSEIDALTGKSSDYGTQILELNRLMLSGALTANDYEAAMEALTKTQLSAAEQAVRVDNMTAEARATRAAAIEREIAVLEDQKQVSGLTADAVQELSDRQEKLRDEYDAITSVSSTYADQLAAEKAAKDALTQQYDNYFDLLDQEADAREKLAGLTEDIAEIEASRADDVSKVLRESEDRRTEILAESAEEQQDIAADSAREIEKIQRDFNKSNKTAIGERDAYGALQAAEQAQERLEDQRINDQKALDAAKKADDKALAQLEKSKNQQLMTIAETAFRETNIKLTEARKQEFLIAQSQASQTWLTQVGMSGVLNATVTGWSGVEVASYNALNRIANYANGIGFGTSTGATPLTGSAADRALEERMRAIADQRVNETLIRAAGGRIATQ